MVAGALTLTPLASSIWVLTGILLVLNICTGSMDVGGNTLLVWVHRDKVGPFMNGLHFFFGVGAFLAPVIVAQVVKRTNEINLAFWIMALMALPVAVWFFFLRSPQSIVRRPSGEHKGPVNVFLVVLVALFLFIYVGAEVGFGNWVFTYTTSLNLADEADCRLPDLCFLGSVDAGTPADHPDGDALQPPREILDRDLAGCLVSILVIVSFPKLADCLVDRHPGIGFFHGASLPHHHLAGRAFPDAHRVDHLLVLRRFQPGRHVPTLADRAAL